MITSPDNITSLESHQVFVFGANSAYGHGGGAAGIAFSGSAKPCYTVPKNKVGRWAVYGQAGYSEGTEGRSYGIVTKEATINGNTLKIGDMRSVPLSQICNNILEFFEFARKNPNLEFLMTKIGCKMAGYTEDEILWEIKYLHDEFGIPDNVRLPKDWHERIGTDMKEHDILLIVAGSRDFTDRDLAFKSLDNAYDNIMQDQLTLAVVSGHARGADTLGEEWAKKHHIDLIVKPAEWDKYGKSAGYKRNEEMCKIGTHAVFFWDGESKGTKHCIDLAIRYGLWTKVILIKSSSSVSVFTSRTTIGL